MKRKDLFFAILLVQVLSVNCKRYGSLSLVIDDTASMRTEIDAIRSASSRFMDTILTQKSSQIDDVVIVTFNDPKSKNEVRLHNTKDKTLVQEALYRIKVHDGDDCPEYSLAGIKTALTESKQDSYLFVFTDASPKDGYVYDFRLPRWRLDSKRQSEEIQAVKNLALKKTSQVFFFITNTPDCNGDESMKESYFNPYWEIATATNGQVFKILKKTDLEKYLEYMKILISGEGDVKVQKTIPKDKSVTIPFTVDNQTEYVLISASTRGKKVVLSVCDEQGVPVTRDDDGVPWTDNNKVFKMSDPPAGNYTATVNGDGQTTVMVFGRTDFTFQHGFGETIPHTFKDEKTIPVDGKKYYLLIKVNDPTHTVDIKTAEINTIGGKNPITLELKQQADGYYTSTEKFLAPSTLFVLTVIGEGKKTGEIIKRTAKTPIEPVPANMYPEVFIDGHRKYKYNTTATLTCIVKAYPRPTTIAWKDQEGNMLNAMKIEQTGRREFRQKINIENLIHMATYYCYADSEKADIDLSVDTPFNIFHNESKASIKVDFEKSATLQCNITAEIPMKIDWLHIVGDNSEDLSKSEYTISKDGRQIIIKEVNKNTEGKYVCIASVLEDSKTIYQLQTDVVINLAAPVTGEPRIVQVKESDALDIKCNISKAYPPPNVTWEFKDYKNNKFKPLFVTGDVLHLNNARHDKTAGVYKCIASNDAGRAEQETTVNVLTPPKISLSDTAIEIEYNSTTEAILICHVASRSRPDIVWKNGKNEIITQIVVKDAEYEYSSTMTVPNLRRNETYYCEAKNEISSSKSSSVEVKVKSPFKYDLSPSAYQRTVRYGEKVLIPCGIQSKFPMNIFWGKGGLYVTDSDKYSVSHGKLTIKQMDLDTEGTYTCHASIADDIETKSVSETRVNINREKPEIQKVLSDVFVFRNEAAILKCKVQVGFPKPKITWMFRKGLDTANEFTLLPEVGDEITVPNAQYSNTGSYKCIAENIFGTDEGTMKLFVQGPPVILTDAESTLFTAVVGDKELRVPCVAEGYPKPDITWKPVIPTERKLKKELDGTLVLTSPTIDDSDKKYICHVNNTFGTYTKVFDTFVSDYLEDELDFGVFKHVDLAPSSSKKLECEKGRWFLNGEPINKTGTLVVNNKDDAKNYTCRQTDRFDSVTYEVVSGFAPKLDEPNDEKYSNWDGKIKYLSCAVKMKPSFRTAEAKWYYNGKESSHLPPNQAKYESTHPVVSWGNYTCNISNIHGYVIKHFQFSSLNCFIKLDSEKTPLVLKPTGTWPSSWYNHDEKGMAMVDGMWSVEPNIEVLFSCKSQTTHPNVFQNLRDKHEVIATCDHEDKFQVDGKLYSLSDLQCDTEVAYTTKTTSQRCSYDNTEMIKIGYNIQHPTPAFLEVYSICYDKVNKLPVYAKTQVVNEKKYLSRINVWRNSNYYNDIGENCTTGCCLIKGQIINQLDVPVQKPAMWSTFVEDLNTVAYWRGCDGKEDTWSALQNYIRSSKKKFAKVPYTLTSGASDYSNKNGIMVPKYLWKMTTKAGISTVIVKVNTPYAKEEDKLCNQKCPFGTTFKNVYCCGLKEFEKNHNVSILV